MPHAPLNISAGIEQRRNPVGGARGEYIDCLVYLNNDVKSIAYEKIVNKITLQACIDRKPRLS